MYPGHYRFCERRSGRKLSRAYPEIIRSVSGNYGTGVLYASDPELVDPDIVAVLEERADEVEV